MMHSIRQYGRALIAAAAVAGFAPAAASADWRMTTPVVNSDASNRATTQGVFDTPVPSLGDCTTQNYPCTSMRVLADGTAGVPRTMHPAGVGQPNGVWQLVAPNSTQIHAKFYKYLPRAGVNAGTYCTRQTLTAGYTLGSTAWAHQVEGQQFKLRTTGRSDPYIWSTLQRAGDRGVTHPEGPNAPILSVRSNSDSGSGGTLGGYKDVVPAVVRTGVPFQVCTVIDGDSWNWYFEQGSTEAGSRTLFADDALGVHMGDVPFSEVSGVEGAWGGSGYSDIVFGAGHYGFSGSTAQFLYLLDMSFTAVGPPPDPFNPAGT
jgi:hypothetical protein